VFRGRTLAVISVICGCVPACAQASQTVKLNVGFSPNEVGTSTTIIFGFQIGTTSGKVPSPVTDVNLRLPVGVGLGNLGLATCNPTALEWRGPSGCSPNALMGLGTALVEVQIGPEVIHEPVRILTFLGPPQNGHTALLFYAEGWSPVAATLVFSGVLRPDSGQFGASLNAAIPLTSSVPGAPDAAVVHVQASLGPKYLTYYRHVHGRMVGYRPEGMTIPTTCPRGGFPFAARFTFQDGTTALATSAVPCPSGHAHRHGKTTSHTHI